MKTFDFIQAAISHNPKDPHSKALPACRQAGNLTASPLRLRLQHSLAGEKRRVTGKISDFEFISFLKTDISPS
jgi:hypothetical protein